MTRKAKEPASDWEMFQCVVKSTANTFEEMKIKRAEALNVTTNCDSSDSDDALSLNASKKRPAVADSSDEDMTPPKKRASMGELLKYI